MCKLPFNISQTKKDAGIFCCAYACFSLPIARKGGLCHKHYARKTKSVDPVYDRYFNFKNNALRRGKEFAITLLQFRVWCNETGYIITKGKRGRNATVDRIDNRIGYTIENITLLTAMQNTRKYYEVDQHLENLPF